MSSESGHLKESEGQFVETVDRKKLWWPKRQPAHKGGANQRAKRGWALFSPWNSNAGASKQGAEETTPMTPVDVSVDSEASVNPVYSLHLSSEPHEERTRGTAATAETNVVKVMDRWVRRCRVAAIVGGIILCVAVIIAAVAVAGGRAG